ncbi:MAG: L-threonine 3-dehydrogenase [Spirochaetaceae bacterium 4572_59]|nr:MAG: L-threonine 3-dehydrogenase [Spirochaetaceae bacterium 4572_59]
MKALSKLKKEPGIWMVDAPKPEYGPNDLLIKIKITAICGTDVHIYNWNQWSQQTIPVPMITGHEFVGTIEAMGSEVVGFNKGDRVSGEGHITCGHCRNCRAGKRHLCRNTEGIGVNRQGCFAEYLVMPAYNAFKLDDFISDEAAAIFDPFGNAVHTALSFDMVGEDVLITGAGPIGIMAAAVAKHAGARYVIITDVNEYRLNLARQMGATRAVNIQTEKLEDVMSELHMLEGFDVGMEMSGNAVAQHQLFKMMNNGGRVALLGIPNGETPVDWNQIIFKGLQLKGIYGREMFETWYKMAAMIRSGLDITRIITHRMPIDEFQKGFDIMCSGQSGKVLLYWD